MDWISQTCLLVASMSLGITCGRIFFQEFGGMDFPSKLCDHFAMKICGLDVFYFCVVIILELWLCNFFFTMLVEWISLTLWKVFMDKYLICFKMQCIHFDGDQNSVLWKL